MTYVDHLSTLEKVFNWILLMGTTFEENKMCIHESVCPIPGYIVDTQGLHTYVHLTIKGAPQPTNQ